MFRQGMDGFYFSVETTIFGNNTNMVLSNNEVSRLEMKANHFMLECTSICPETT